MILWTIQSIEAWKTLQKKGALRADPRVSLREGVCSWGAQFANAYEWMASQMRSRLPRRSEDGDKLPLWAWYQWSGTRRRRPSLRSYNRKERGVRIEFEADENQVLLSDFTLWGFYALNYWYLPASTADDDAFESELAEHGFSFYKTKPLPHPGYHERIVRSWERIFDLDWEDSEYSRPRDEKSIQATLWELRLSQVRKWKEFGRNTEK